MQVLIEDWIEVETKHEFSSALFMYTYLHSYQCIWDRTSAYRSNHSYRLNKHGAAVVDVTGEFVIDFTRQNVILFEWLISLVLGFLLL